MPLLRAPVLLLLCFAPVPALAEAVSILGSASLFKPARGLIQARAEGPAPQGERGHPSLFIDREGESLFARRVTPEPSVARAIPALSGSAIDRLRHLIGLAESRRHGYDAVQYGARIKTPKRPTDMTIGEIYAWIRQTPGQPHAIGRYQFIPVTLRRLVKALGVTEDQRFSPALQDALADELLVEAGLNEIRQGRMPRHRFMHNLAKIWAGLPTANGRSYYHGYAGNRASLSWAQYDAEMAQIFPG